MLVNCTIVSQLNYNVKLETFPTTNCWNISAEQTEFLQMPEEKAVPKVNFSGLGD